jgi:hypothetical protein
MSARSLAERLVSGGRKAADRQLRRPRGSSGRWRGVPPRLSRRPNKTMLNLN